MSEYQYYEFLAIDKPLTDEQMEELNALSTRAEITPVSFVNIYNWGDFKGDPDELMEHYFDIHVYVANWMTAIFKVRLPLEALEKSVVNAMDSSEVLNFTMTRSHWIITWLLNESEDYDRFALEDGQEWMTRLSPVRDELLRGDYRSLYIGWLGAVSMETMTDSDLEPMPMNGLGELTEAQRSLAEFLEVDIDLLEATGTDSPSLTSGEIS